MEGQQKELLEKYCSSVCRFHISSMNHPFHHSYHHCFNDHCHQFKNHHHQVKHYHQKNCVMSLCKPALLSLNHLIYQFPDASALGMGNPRHIATKSLFCMVVVLVLKSWDWVRPPSPYLIFVTGTTGGACVNFFLSGVNFSRMNAKN